MASINTKYPSIKTLHNVIKNIFWEISLYFQDSSFISQNILEVIRLHSKKSLIKFKLFSFELNNYIKFGIIRKILMNFAWNCGYRNL